MTRRRDPNPGLLRRLRGNSDGAALVEFAIVAPALVVMIMGLMDITHTQYTSSVLYGALQKAGRDLTLENANARQEDIDKRVRDHVSAVMPIKGEVTVKKLSHFDFSDVAVPEDFSDMNGDGVCNANEPYIDTNSNSRWDADRGRTGIGGARDVVAYEATVTYPRLFPMYGLIGLPQTVTLKAATVLRNQPFDEQGARVTTQRNCA